jgi:hypothetical protein
MIVDRKLYIIDDLLQVAPNLPKHLGFPISENIQECFLKLFIEQDISKPESLSEWIGEYLGHYYLTELLTILNIPFDKNSTKEALIEKWFKFRKIILDKPDIRPTELASNTYELALQVNAMPDTFNGLELILPYFDLLIRYLVYYYFEELIKQENLKPILEPLRKKYDSSSEEDILVDISFEQLCNILACEKPLKFQPYDPICNHLIYLIDDNKKDILKNLGEFVNNKSSIESFASSLIKIFEFWFENQSKPVIPKGAIVINETKNGFNHEFTCLDEFNRTLKLDGVNSILDIGSNLLIANRSENCLWCSKIKSLPNDGRLKTPSFSIPDQGNDTLKKGHNSSIINAPKVMKGIFISYNHKDKAIAIKAKSELECSGFRVVMDIYDMKAGENINEFIEKNIKKTDITLLLVSKNSLYSPWVAMEIIFTRFVEKLRDHKIIPCKIDNEFFKIDFVDNAFKAIDEHLSKIGTELEVRLKNNTEISDLKNERTRYLNLKERLPDIVAELKDSLCLDFTKNHFEDSIAKIIGDIS